MHYTPDTLVTEMDQLGCPVTKRRLLDWVQKGLLPHPRPRGRGRGQGKVYAWTEPAILHRAVDVYDLLAWHRRAADLFLPLWVLGYEVPVAEVRTGLRQVIEGLDAGLDAAIPIGGDRSDLVSDLLAAAQQQMPQPNALPLPMLAGFLHAVLNPDMQHWSLVVDDLTAALAFDDGERAGWPDVRGTTDLLSFVRAQLSMPRLREIVATASDAELAQVHHDLRRVVQSARAVVNVGFASDAWLLIRVFVWLGVWGGMLDLAVRRAGGGGVVDECITQFEDACRQLLTNPRLRAELHRLQAGNEGMSETVREAVVGTYDTT